MYPSRVRFPRLLKTLAFVPAFALLLHGCSSGGGGTTPPPPSTPLAISVSLSPTTVSVLVATGTQAFTASVQNDSQNRGVAWALSGVGCSGATCGTLSNATTTSVTYTAPANEPTPSTVTLTATSVR